MPDTTVPENTAAVDQALSALVAAGDVAYVWDVASDRVRWHGAIEALDIDATDRQGAHYFERIHQRCV